MVDDIIKNLLINSDNDFNEIESRFPEIKRGRLYLHAIQDRHNDRVLKRRLTKGRDQANYLKEWVEAWLKKESALGERISGCSLPVVILSARHFPPKQVLLFSPPVWTGIYEALSRKLKGKLISNDLRDFAVQLVPALRCHPAIYTEKEIEEIEEIERLNTKCKTREAKGLRDVILSNYLSDFTDKPILEVAAYNNASSSTTQRPPSESTKQISSNERLPIQKDVPQPTDDSLSKPQTPESNYQSASGLQASDDTTRLADGNDPQEDTNACLQSPTSLNRDDNDNLIPIEDISRKRRLGQHSEDAPSKKKKVEVREVIQGGGVYAPGQSDG